MIIVACIDIDDLTSEKDALVITKQLVRACCEINRQTPMREKKNLSNKMEALRKVCHIEGWQLALVEMKKGFKILKEVNKTEVSMLSELFDIT